VTLTPGARLGPYEIVAKLGEGGPPPPAGLTPRGLRRDRAV